MYDGGESGGENSVVRRSSSNANACWQRGKYLKKENSNKLVEII